MSNERMRSHFQCNATDNEASHTTEYDLSDCKTTTESGGADHCNGSLVWRCLSVVITFRVRRSRGEMYTG